MIDKYLAWINCNIARLEEEGADKNRSHHDRRRKHYQRDILNEARDAYLKCRPAPSVPWKASDAPGKKVRVVCRPKGDEGVVGNPCPATEEDKW